MRPPARLLATALAAVITLTTAAACSSEGPEGTLEDFLAGWSTGELDTVRFVSADGTPVAAADVAGELTELSGPLGELAPGFSVGDVTVTEQVATAPVRVDWPLSSREEASTWSYETSVRLSEGEDGWRVIWEPTVVHPELRAGDELVVQRTPAARGRILGADGDSLMSPHDVVDVGIWAAQATDLEADLATLVSALGSIGVDIDLAELEAEVAAADPDHFVHVVTLRWDDYEPIRGRIRDLEATDFRERERHLAPTRTFARALLGLVDDATAEIIDNNPGVYQAGDQVGQGGLSQAYDAQLRGVPGQSVRIARTAPNDEVNHIELFSADPVAGTDLETTVDPDVQRAAEQALHQEELRASLVAVRISDGAVQAVANTHGEAAEPVNLAFTASVPPGSTFKMVSAYGLLASGELELDSDVACPAELTVDDFTITNSFSGDRGEIPFQEAVAISCNTAFASVADRLGDDGLATAGAALGIGGDWELGPETFTGSVGTGGSALDQAVAAFGQGETQVSPVAMAAATAAVARGQWLPPALVVDPEADAGEPTELDDGAVADLHEALRDVVTDGTASALAGVPGGAVHGKTGTAEAGEQTHGWFVGWQDDLAFAVFVEDGDSSARAVSLAGDFLRDSR